MKFTGWLFISTVILTGFFGLSVILYLLGLIVKDVVLVIVILLCIICTTTIITWLILKYRNLFK